MSSTPLACGWDPGVQYIVGLHACNEVTNQPVDFELIKKRYRGAWVVQWVGRLTSAQAMISGFVSSSPASGSVLMARSLEPASDSVSPSLSAPPPLVLCLSLSKINLKKN